MDTLKPLNFDKNVKSTEKDRARVRNLVSQGRGRDAEPDTSRAKNYASRLISPTIRGPEAIVGNTDDLQAVSFLVEGAQVRRAVGFVEVSLPTSSSLGSGFLISPRLFMTNCHVIPDDAAARSTRITFDREATIDGSPSPTTSFLLDPDTLALFSAEDELDYAIIAVGRRDSGTAELSDLMFCPISNTPDRHRLGMNVNIIQHPRGLPKFVAVRNNLLTARTDSTLLYETDTDVGSSGSPVYNDAWDVVALHHWGEPQIALHEEHQGPLPKNVNEGVRISAIYTDLQRRAASLPQAARVLVEQALSYAAADQRKADSHVLTPPRPAAGPESVVLPSDAKGNLTVPTQNQARFVLPIEITVSVGGQQSLATSPATSPTLVSSPTLTHGAEVVKLDTDYGNRKGYAPEFIEGFQIPLPEPSEALKKQVAPLRAGEENAASGELKYEHFSIKMHRAKHLAIFTATNIDGETYLTVDRTTGQVSDSAEGDRWFKDPRISETFWTGQDFYSEWSDYFDRGHLTRRTDPTWGQPDEAERANADTFHFTNCSPQHFRFNENSKFWQGVERYVLENGVLTTDQRKRLIVFQGPIFDDRIDQYAGDLQIPSSFFKIVVWKGKEVLRAVGLIVDQSALLSEKRVSLGKPHELPFVNVNHWRVSIASIEQKTNLNFGDAVRNADTFSQDRQPQVGAEKAVRIRDLRDLLPEWSLAATKR